MLCPRCNREYSEEFENCLACGAKLVEYQSILAEDALMLDDQPEEELLLTDENLPELLVTVVGEEEARQTVKRLHEMNIPCMCRKSEEEGEDLFDLLVPGSFWSEAMNLLEQEEQQPPEEQPEENTVPPEEPAPKKWYEFWK